MADRMRTRAGERIVLLLALALAGGWLSGIGRVGMAWAADPASTVAAPALPSLDEMVARLPHFTVAGRVVGKDGEGVEGADVFLHYPSIDYGVRGRLIGKTKSGTNGVFRFENAGVWEPPVPGHSIRDAHRYYILARHPRHGVEFAVLLKGDPTEDVVVRMQAPQTYTVLVKDTAGKPVAGAQAFLFNGRHFDAVKKQVDAEHGRDYQYMSLWQDIGICSGVTDADGSVSLVGPADAGFMAIKDGYAKGISADSNIVLCPGARLSGKVTRPDGSPAAGAAVLFEYSGQQMSHFDSAITDAQGRYRFEHLPGSGYYWAGMSPEEHKGQGMATLWAHDLRPGTNLVSKEVTFPINPGDGLARDISLRRGVVLAGKVVDFDSGHPLAGIDLGCHVRSAGARSDSMELETDSEGRFHAVAALGDTVAFRWLPYFSDGSYLIDSGAERNDVVGAGTPIHEQIVTQDRMDLVFRLKRVPLQPLAGRVVDEGGRAVQGAAIHVYPPLLRETYSNATGAFALKAAFKERDFDLWVVSADKKLGRLVHLKAGTTQAAIALAPTLAPEGEVRTPDDLPAGNLKFYFTPQLNGTSISALRQVLTTDRAGKFKAAEVLPGAAYQAWWVSNQDENRDYDNAEVMVDLGQLKPGEPIRFRATQFLNALMGKVADEKGRPIAGASVDPEESGLMPRDARGKSIMTDARGEFTMTRLAPGTITLRVTAAGYESEAFKTPTDAVDFVAVLKRPGP